MAGRPTKLQSRCIEVLHLIRSLTDSDGRKICLLFEKLPTQEEYPDYYRVIKEPLDLHTIQLRNRQLEYKTLDDMVKDVMLLVKNAHTYNEPGSQIYKDAAAIKKAVSAKKAEMDDPSPVKPTKVLERRRSKNPAPSGSDHENLQAEEDGDEKKDGPITGNLDNPLVAMFNNLVSLKDKDGVLYADPFWRLPSKRLYPDYYKVISKPFSLNIIKKKFKSGSYTSVEDLDEDLSLIFGNAKLYNEDHSEIFKAADALQDAWINIKPASPEVTKPSGPPSKKAKLSSETSAFTPVTPTKVKTPVTTAPDELQIRLKVLYNTIRNHMEGGRTIADAYFKLPSAEDYPDYYEIIKSPMDLKTISKKIMNKKYPSESSFMEDVYLMLENARLYNEEDSQIYQDAVILEKLVQFKTKVEPPNSSSSSISTQPDISGVVQDLLRTLYNRVISFQDHYGRTLSDSLREVVGDVSSSTDPIRSKRSITLGIIGRALEQGLYKRLDCFQADMFAVFSSARETNRLYSETFEDSFALQTCFIRERDSLCMNGERLQSTAFSFDCNKLSTEKKLLIERRNQAEPPITLSWTFSSTFLKEIENLSDDPIPSNPDFVEHAVYNGVSYSIGDFIYLNTGKNASSMTVGEIKKIWSYQRNRKCFLVNLFLKPEQITLKYARKFLPRELLRTDIFNVAGFDKVYCKCCVVGMPEFGKIKVEDFSDDDVHVAEVYYDRKSATILHLGLEHQLRVTCRSKTLPSPTSLSRAALPDRSPAMLELKRKSAALALETNFSADAYSKACHLLHQSILMDPQPSDAVIGCAYYEQYATDSSYYKLGDVVLVRSDEEYPYMIRITKIWTVKDGTAMFLGNWYVRPEEVVQVHNQLFFEQEVMHSNLEDTNTIANIIGKCYIMSPKDYTLCRPTETPEREVYICESRYNESDNSIKPLNQLKTPTLSPSVLSEELYFFEKPLVLNKKPCPWLTEKGVLKADGPDVGSLFKKRIREQNGYSLFASEVGPVLSRTLTPFPAEEYESRVVHEWHKLSSTKKTEYEARARAQNGPSEGEFDDGSMLVYECSWQGCDSQFDDLRGLMAHVMETGGHLQRIGDSFPCLWTNCIRAKKGLGPFPVQSKLARHCREVHFKAAARRIQPHEKRASDEAAADLGSNQFQARMASLNHTPAAMTFQQALTGYPSPAAHGSTVMPMGMVPMHHHQQQQQQQLLVLQNQKQQQQIQQLQEQVQHLVQQLHRQEQLQQQQQLGSTPGGPSTAATTVVTPSGANAHLTSSQTPAPLLSSSQSKLRHSDIYLKYIEGLRDNTRRVSSWTEVGQMPNKPTPQSLASLPINWLGGQSFNYRTPIEALWSLRDYMLQENTKLR